MAPLMLLTLFLCVIKQKYCCVSELSAARHCEADDKEEYSYHGSTNGPEKWPSLFPACDRKTQSPVNIQTKNVRTDRQLSKLSFFGYDSPIEEADVGNNGHTVVITPQDDVNRGITIDGTDYDLQQFHFHWGSESKPGSEHTLNRHRFEMEVHFVHTSSDNRIAVVGMLVKMAGKDNRAFQPIVEVLSDVLYKGDSTDLQSSLNLNQLLPWSPASYYRYNGSLTTPMCREGVTWFVLKDVKTIGRKQLNSFLKVYSVEKEDRSSKCLLAPNNRPVQDLNGRIIYASP